MIGVAPRTGSSMSAGRLGGRGTDRIDASASIPAGPTQSPATARPRTPAASTAGRPGGAVASPRRAWSPLTSERGT